ncbi:voltage-dependent calcium channel gamma-5 subunit-like [Petromyzon marinus]|uniref:voltage-dependent calcium channel gamma-5 subunit-like n=1 Tax=Petromyzon marinus TaxID=7757 RepID=UPI003F6FDAB6
MGRCGRRSLTLLSSGLSVLGLCALCVAVSTDFWLYSHETLFSHGNRTRWLHVAVHSGLWRVCSLAEEDLGSCSNVQYFTASGSHIASDSTANVLRLMRSATPFPLAALLLMLLGFVINNLGHVRPQRTALAFVSGIFFILAGLALVVGLVLYISSVNDEVTSRSSENSTSFTYSYGWSFHFAVLSFFLTEGAGVVSVYLFMKRYRTEEEFRPHASLYRTRLSNCSDYSAQFLQTPLDAVRPPSPASPQGLATTAAGVVPGTIATAAGSASPWGRSRGSPPSWGPPEPDSPAGEPPGRVGSALPAQGFRASGRRLSDPSAGRLGVNYLAMMARGGAGDVASSPC